MIKIIMGLPYSGKSKLAGEISREHSSCKIWNINNAVMSSLKSFVEDFTFYSENYSLNILTGIFYRTSCVEKILVELSKYQDLYGDKIIEIHYLIPNVKQSLLNEKWDTNENFKNNDITNIVIEEPDIKYLSSKFKFKINLHKHETVGKTAREVNIKLFAVKHFKNNIDNYYYYDDTYQQIYGDQWRNHNDKECEMCHIDIQEDIKPSIDNFKILKQFFNFHFNDNIPSSLVEELFDKHVYIDDIEGYCDYCFQKNRVLVCDLDNLYDFLDEKGIITLVQLC